MRPRGGAATRRLVISDLHFGGGDELAHHPRALERLEPHLHWADELIVNGDLFELIFGPLGDAVTRSRPFFELVNRSVKTVRYIPGNHDHHFVALAGDERRLAAVTGDEPSPAERVPPAERVLRALCPDVEILTGYPVVTLDGVTFHHGHYIGPHVEGLGWRMLDRLSWHLTGSERPERLTLADYEALQGPLAQLMYEVANLPRGVQAQQSMERRLAGIGALMRAPTNVTRQISGLVRRSQEELVGGQARVAITAVCMDLDIAPGAVCFGHTHSPLTGVPSTDAQRRWTLFNSGSWVWDRRLRDRPRYRDESWPGTVLRCEGPDVEPHALLADLDERDLQAMVPEQPAEPVTRRRAAKDRIVALRATS